MSDTVVQEFLLWLFKGRYSLIATDFMACESQKSLTTKHARREKALAYIIESVTGDVNHFIPTKDECETYLVVVGRLQANVKTDEAKVGLERAEKRLRWFLEHPEELSKARECVACGDVYFGDDHVCTNRTAAAKDAQMQRDDTVV